MAYYPLKVKDDQGNTHVVGDPRVADKADSSALTAHTSSTTSVHGITDTSLLETTAGAQAKADAAQSAAEATAADAAVAKALISGSKGALITSTGSAVDDLTVGTDGHVLTADSNETLGIKWAAPSGGGGLNPFLLMGA